MPPNVTACIQGRQKKLSTVPILLLVFGALLSLQGAAQLVSASSKQFGVFPVGLPLGLAMDIAGVVLLLRGRSITNDPVYKVLSNPSAITGMHIAKTDLTVGGSAVTSVDSVVIAHSGGSDVWLPIRKDISRDALVAELRQLCPHAAPR